MRTGRSDRRASGEEDKKRKKGVGRPDQVEHEPAQLGSRRWKDWRFRCNVEKQALVHLLRTNTLELPGDARLGQG